MDQKVLQTDRHRYVVVSPLAEGALGWIYLGRRISASADGVNAGRSADVVLKHLPPEHSADPKLIEMFKREAALSHRLDHPNIVRTLDLVNAGEDYYIVMEHVRGGDLRTILRRAKRRQQRLSIDSALFIASEVLGALSYAHALRTAEGRPLGVVHRDVSPSNILLGADGVVKLTDFGIAKSPTQGSVVFKLKGKLGYMSPEQARGEPVDLRSDLFAVGVVLYEALVGERLFVGQIAQAAAVYSQAVRAPSKKRPEVGSDIDEIVLRSLALDPAGRYASAQEFRTAILRAAERTRRKLGEASLAADLRHACGDDSTSWLNLDVPAAATLDGSAADGTGVILTDDDEFEEERPLTGARPAVLPSKELTSVVALVEDGRGVSRQGDRDADADLPATYVARDPFAMRAPTPQAAPAPQRSPPSEGEADRLAFTRTDFALPVPAAAPTSRASAQPFGPGTDYDTEEDSAVRTRVQGAEALLRRVADSPPAQSRPPVSQSRPPASQSKPPASQSRPPASQSKPPASQSKPPISQSKPPVSQSKPPTSQSRTPANPSSTAAQRAHFEAPVPRPSLPPPSAAIELPPAAAEPTRMGRVSEPGPPVASPTPASPAATRITRLPPEPAAAPGPSSALPTRLTLSSIDDARNEDARGPGTAQDPTGVWSAPGASRGDRSFEEGRSEATLRPRTASPASLSALERNLGGRPVARRALGILLILVLVALGIGLGVLLSGPSGDGLDVPPATDRAR